MRYLSKSDADRREMLAACGLDSEEQLYSHLPPEALLDRPLAIYPGKSEYDIVDYFLSAQESQGPEGGCVGSELRVLVGLPTE